MLDLQAGIHLEEKERAVLAGHKLDRTGTVIANGFGQRHGLLSHGTAGLFVEQG